MTALAAVLIPAALIALPWAALELHLRLTGRETPEDRAWIRQLRAWNAQRQGHISTTIEPDTARFDDAIAALRRREDVHTVRVLGRELTR